jgi:hypothetical protein
MNNLLSLSSSQLKQAADIKDQIEALNQKLAALIGASTSPVAEAPVRVGKTRKFSAAGLARLRAAQKARWAKVKAQKPEAAPAKNGKPAKKRKMSAAAKAAISAAAKARWAKAKAAGKSSL